MRDSAILPATQPLCRRSMRLVMLLVLAVAAGCERPLPLDDRACPCVVGYVCDVTTHTCVRDTDSAADAAVADGRPSGYLTRQLISADRGKHVDSIWASGSNDIYVAGTGVFHSAGDGSWDEITPAGAALEYHAIWGSGAGDLYMGVVDNSSASALLHLTGVDSWAWAAVPFAITAIWGSAADDVWAVSQSGVIMHSTRRDIWEQVASPASGWLSSVWGTSRVNAYAVGQDGTILRWDGNMWFSEDSGVEEGLYLVWGTGPDDIYAVSGNGTILRSTGDGRWTASPIPVGGGALWRSGDGEVYLAGCGQMLRLASDGTWLPVEDGIVYPCIQGAWGTALDHLYLVDSEAFVLYRS